MIKTINGIPVFQWDVTREDERDGVSIMSIVNEPAVCSHFLAYADEQPTMYNTDDELHVVSGVALRAGFPILREDEAGLYYTLFTPEAIRWFVYKFMHELHNNDVSIGHRDSTDGAFLFESYILTEQLKAAQPQYEHIDVGSWIVSYKITDEALWQRIKSGGLNGFSVEVFGGLIPYDENLSKEAMEKYRAAIPTSRRERLKNVKNTLKKAK